MSDVVLDCRGGGAQGILIALDPVAGPGNLFTPGTRPAGLLQAATYRSSSPASADGNPMQHVSWAVSVAPDLNKLAQAGAAGCVLKARATASQGPLQPVEGGYSTPAASSIRTWTTRFRWCCPATGSRCRAGSTRWAARGRA